MPFNECFVSYNIAQFTDSFTVQLLDKPTAETHLQHIFIIFKKFIVILVLLEFTVFIPTIKEFTLCFLREPAGIIKCRSTALGVCSCKQSKHYNYEDKIKIQYIWIIPGFVSSAVNGNVALRATSIHFF